GPPPVPGFPPTPATCSARPEPFFTAATTINGQTVRQAKWLDWNDYVEELSFAQAFRNALVSRGFPSNIGMLIDTSRNGWGSCNRTPCQPLQTTRPTAAST